MTEKRVPVEVKGVFYFKDDQQAEWFYLQFADEAKRDIRIFIGQFEAWAIQLGLEDKPLERPLTYDTMINCLAVAGATVEEAYIHELRAEIFYAVVNLRVGDQVHQIDMRPSDAVNLAVRMKCPLLINEEVIQAWLSRQSSME
ncbi:MAG: bifunctional nuclease family protein [Janthinobacterium lividum]